MEVKYTPEQKFRKKSKQISGFVSDVKFMNEAKLQFYQLGYLCLNLPRRLFEQNRPVIF